MPGPLNSVNAIDSTYAPLVGIEGAISTIDHGHELRSPCKVTPLSITVVIPTRNRGDLIAGTLESLKAVEYPVTEILVVDQSTDQATRNSVLELARKDQRIRLVSTSTVGTSKGRNLGAKLSTGEIIAYTDDDCIVTGHWLNAIAAEFEDEETVAVYGRLLPYERGNRNGREVGYKPTLEREVFLGRKPPWHIGHGGNMAFRRNALLEVGAFDPQLSPGGRFGSGEDSDIAYRLLRQGKRIAYAPEALAYHKHWKDWPSQRKMERAYGVGAGAQFMKYVRCGDPYGLQLFVLWVWQLGVRRLLAGLFKWHSLKTMYLGYCQLVYPWLGLLRSLGDQIDNQRVSYVED